MTATTKEAIREWLESAKAEGATHMLVVCDTFNYEDYPVKVYSADDAAAEIAHYRDAPMSRVMEVYKLDMDIDAQLAERRAWHV